MEKILVATLHDGSKTSCYYNANNEKLDSVAKVERYLQRRYNQPYIGKIKAFRIADK